MAVPEAATHLDHLLPRRENHVRRSWKVSPVQAETVAHRVSEATNDQLGLRILPANAGHHLGSLLGGEGVGHG
jgi:hypothetical protein